jgi:SAM-dependent methyltransferase
MTRPASTAPVTGGSDGGRAQVAVNTTFWGRDRYLDDYRNRVLKPAEVLLLVRHREAFSGRVVEIGCGGGRLLSYLVKVARQAEGIDVSPTMVSYCRAAFPAARVTQGDLRALGSCLDGAYDVVLASDNIIDILDDSERRRVLFEIGQHYLVSGGLLVFSTHNLAHVAAAPPTADDSGAASRTADDGGGQGSRVHDLMHKALNTSPAALAQGLTRRGRAAVNRRRLAPLQYRGADHAVLNDEAHEYGLLHYYIRRDDQQRQLEQLGYELVGCLELDGEPVGPGLDGIGPSLYYVASKGSIG